jgi:hypothetical protein
MPVTYDEEEDLGNQGDVAMEDSFPMALPPPGPTPTPASTPFDSGPAAPSFQDIQMPMSPHLRPSDINSGMALIMQMRAKKESDQAAAVRWQGQQEFQALVKNGAQVDEALRATSSKIFYKAPQEMRAALKYMQPAKQVAPIPGPVMENIGGQNVIVETDRFGQKRTKPITASSPADTREWDASRLKASFAEKEVVRLEKQLDDLAKLYPDAKSRKKEEYKTAEAALLKKLGEAEARRDVLATAKRTPSMIGPEFPMAAMPNAPAAAVAGPDDTSPDTSMAKYPPATRTVVEPPTERPAAAASPFSEGQVVRSKKDGKLYIIRNGKPEPMKE